MSMPANTDGQKPTPIYSETLVKQSTVTLYYYPQQQALYAILDLHLVEAAWITLPEPSNTLTVQRCLLSSPELTEAWPIIPLSLFSAPLLHFTPFSPELSDTPTVQSLPPNAFATHQRRYYFQAIVWFQLEVFGPHAWYKVEVGHWDAPVKGLALVVNWWIDSGEWIGADGTLVCVYPREPAGIKYEDMVQRVPVSAWLECEVGARQYLEKRRVRPPPRMRQFLSPPLPPPSMNIRTPTPPRAAGNHANAQARELSVTRDKLARITLRPSVTMSMLEKQKVGPRAEVKDEITAMEGLVIRSPPSEVEESSMENDELGFGCNPLPQCIPEPMQVSPSVPVPLMPRPEPIPVATAISTPVTVNSISNTTTIITSNSVQMPVPETKPASDAILQPISQTSFTSTPLPVSPPPASFLATPPTINPSSISPAVPTSASTPAFISAPVPVTVPVPTSVFQSPITEIPEKPEVQEKVRLVFS